MCCIVGGGPVMLMGRGRGVCSDSWRWCCLLRTGLVPILHMGESGGKEEYESMVVISILGWMSGAVCGPETKTGC
jgi:hypothetical protein